MAEPVLLSLELPASHRYLNVLGACIAEMLKRVEDEPVDEKLIYELQLAAQEVSTNIVNHAYQSNYGRINIDLSYDPDTQQFAIKFMDMGQVFPGYDNPLPAPEALDHGGMGLFLIKALVDDVQYQRTNEVNIWQLAKKLSSND
jgi:serine/threonine-protein kinase RsbW